MLDELRERLKKKKNFNQNTKHVAPFPLRYLENKWPPPNSLRSNLSHVDYLLPFLGDIAVHMPDKARIHLLPDGCIPYKWHGWSKYCIINSIIFSQNGPRNVFHEYGSVEFKFSSTYICSVRKREAHEKTGEAKRQVEGNLGDVDEAATTFNTSSNTEFWSFTGSDPEAVARLPAKLRSEYNCVTTWKKAINVDFVNSIVAHMARNVSFFRYEEPVC
jgi:hypothetical protein